MNMKIIQTEKKLCTCCMEEHEVKIIHVQEQVTYKNVSVGYLAEYFYCDRAEEVYMDERMTSENDIRMKDSYRTKMGLLTAKEISDVRSKYNISQMDMCVLLGWGGKTITRYEGHQVQDKAHNSILKKLNQDPEWFLHLLSESKESVSVEAYKRYLETATLLYERSQDSYLRKAIKARYVRFYNNNLYNGNVQLSLDKVIDIIRYYANSSDVTNLYKVKLMKLLWYTDALSYKLYGHAITGLVYQAMPMGAVPIGHDSIINLKGISYEEIEIGDGTAYHFNKSGSDIYPYLLEDDKVILDQVISVLGRMTKEEIVSFMHKEQAYIMTAPKEIISFEHAKLLQIG